MALQRNAVRLVNTAQILSRPRINHLEGITLVLQLWNLTPNSSTGSL